MQKGCYAKRVLMMEWQRHVVTPGGADREFWLEPRKEAMRIWASWFALFRRVRQSSNLIPPNIHRATSAKLRLRSSSPQMQDGLMSTYLARS